MARPANGSLRDATKNAVVSSDDVDLGWDEVPASVTGPPPPVEGAAQKVSEIRALSRSRELDKPNFRRHQLGPAVIVSAMALAIALLVASGVSSQFPSVAAPSPDIVATQLPKEPVAQPQPEPQTPEPAPSATESTSAGPSAVIVAVKVIPENAVIFRGGEKLGSGAIELSVERNAKEHLTAFHDGYMPSNFTVDDSRDTVTVRLRRIPSLQASATYVSDSPF